METKRAAALVLEHRSGDRDSAYHIDNPRPARSLLAPVLARVPALNRFDLLRRRDTWPSPESPWTWPGATGPSHRRMFRSFRYTACQRARCIETHGRAKLLRRA